MLLGGLLLFSLSLILGLEEIFIFFLIYFTPYNLYDWFKIDFLSPVFAGMLYGYLINMLIEICEYIFKNNSSKYLALPMVKMGECCRFKNRFLKGLMLLHQRYLLLLIFSYCDFPKGNPYID